MKFDLNVSLILDHQICPACRKWSDDEHIREYIRGVAEILVQQGYIEKADEETKQAIFDYVKKELEKEEQENEEEKRWTGEFFDPNILFGFDREGDRE